MHSIQRLVLILGLFLAVPPAGAQGSNFNDLQVGLQGLLPLPEVFNLMTTQSCPAKPRKVPLYATPADAQRGHAPVAHLAAVQEPLRDSTGHCTWPEFRVRWVDGKASAELPTLEYGYELPAAVVLAQSGDMLQIATDRQPAWLRRPGLKSYLPAGKLLEHQMMYMQAELPPIGRQEPDGAEPIDLAWKPEAVSLKGTRNVKGRLWLRLEVSAAPICGIKDDAPKDKALVWVPFHDATGRPNVWFYSRGC